MKQIKQNRYNNSLEYGVLSALFDMYPESQVGLVAPQAQVAFDLAKKYLDSLHDTKRMKAVLLPRRPTRITNASHKRLIEMFEETGSSYHSGNATLLQYLIDYCEEKGYGYTVYWQPPHRASITQRSHGAYVIEKTVDAPLNELLERRGKAVTSLLDSMEHLPREQQFAIMTSWVDLKRLEEMAEFQRRPEAAKLKKIEKKVKKYVKGFEGFE